MSIPLPMEYPSDVAAPADFLIRLEMLQATGTNI